MIKKFNPDKKFTGLFIMLLLILSISSCDEKASQNRVISKFNDQWYFTLSDSLMDASSTSYDHSTWRSISLPHDWSIEGRFSEDNHAGVGGGALPGGIGWYRKSFRVDEEDRDKFFFIDFDGVYQDSEVWINGYKLGKRPNGYISFRYELTSHLNFENEENIIAVKVDNSHQPNSRWYSGSGIYRNVWLVKTSEIYVDHWGSRVATPYVTNDSASIELELSIRNRKHKQNITVTNTIISEKDSVINSKTNPLSLDSGISRHIFRLMVEKPEMWSVGHPFMYKIVTSIRDGERVLDTYETPLGLRYFRFDSLRGFLLNGEQVKIKGVCNHHALGALGSAINTRAIERQLEIMKEMGVNGIRTSHNPPAPELLQLCDSMGFIVMDEAFDMWAIPKTEFDYSKDWEKWHMRDLEDLIKRDRNHPSIFIWSIGNEILEQWDSTGIPMAAELAEKVRSMDNRPVTSALNDPRPENFIYRSGALDLVGFNYKHLQFEDFKENFPGEIFIATETTSALATRGHYDLPSDTIRRWPIRWDIPLIGGNPENTVSAYDHVSTPWGSTHEETWKVIKKHDYLSGMYIWTGFDYLGEPTPYGWPSRSSYFGIVDLAGFPKDSYFMYKSEWTKDTVLHVFPHWNWEEGQKVDIWAYYNNADEAELFLNGESKGTRHKEEEDLHVMWRLNYVPGTIRVVSRKNGGQVAEKEIKSAGMPAQIELEADRSAIRADGLDLSFITVRVLDKNGTEVPDAQNLIKFTVEGNGQLIAVDNGNQISHESFQADERKVFNGLALAVLRSSPEKGTIKLTAGSEGLQSDEIIINTE